MRSGAEPRVCSFPPYRYSHGDDAIDQASLAGLRLDDWQCDVLRHALGEREDGKWSAFEVGLVVGRQQGKGAILEARALAGLLLLDEELILWSAHEYRTAMEMFRRVKADLRRLARRITDTLYDYDGIPIKVNNTNGDESLERLDTGQRLQFIARSKNAGRGFSADCLIWDEAYALTEDQVDAQMPTLLARPNAQIWYTSSPPLDSVTGGQLFQVRKRGMADSPGLAYFEWGADGCLDDLAKVDLDDRGVWADALPAYGGRVSDEGVKRLRDAMSDPGFAREVLCIWPPEPDDGPPQWQVITHAAWKARLDPRSQLEGRPAYGVYVPPDRSCTAIGVAGARLGGGRHIEVAGDGQILDYRPGTRWVIPRLVELDKHEPLVLVIDDKALADEAEAAGLVVHRATVGDMVTGCQLLYDGVCGDFPDVFHIGQQELTDAAAGAIKRDVGGSWAWARRDLAVETATLASVSLALFGHSTARVHRADQRPGAAFVPTAPRRSRQVEQFEDINQQRLREQLERDLVGR